MHNEIKVLREALAWYADLANYDSGTPGRPLGGHYDRWHMDNGEHARRILAKYRWEVSKHGKLQRIPCQHRFEDRGSAISRMTRVGSADDLYSCNVCGEGWMTNPHVEEENDG
jgi:hypothetical protein